ncbi:unnamed protein product [Paramecium pentaurelia]|uniref:MORN repeat protein n=1 Tax=Paramecium pentaurelia TaxID=43138 RepID=A0A8S1S6Q1_9CILI|nr:unnamed protein product [Paramecium pentaurelia]
MGGSCCKDENLETNKEIRNVPNKPIFSHAENLPPRSQQTKQNQEIRTQLLQPTIPIQNQQLQIPVIHNGLVKEMLTKLGEYQIPQSITNEGLDVTPPIQFDDGSIYVGGIKNDLFQGYGEIYWDDGTHYWGQFNKGTKSGHGRLIYPDGDAYEGEWLDDRQHGKGKYWYSDGGIYDGRFLNDLKHGFGKEILANGETYEGDFNNGKRHGKGKLIMADVIFEGLFENGQMVDGEYKWNDGRRYKGQIQFNKIHGHGEFWFPDGRYYKGYWVEDQKEGQGEFHYSDGSIYVGEWKKNKQNGYGKFTNKNGEVINGQWVDGSMVK